ncbi:uncharacterized protein LOC129751457 [Uranotaenia lowii]|uniref:uncharacterized protein LOC129751457 n=1 Tax=Uranotaenia lowii TaxID=190385 RepID=UPI0024795998|nr:uncharacterized protein LOC129751457 [Uranotaenia lowii]
MKITKQSSNIFLSVIETVALIAEIEPSFPGIPFGCQCHLHAGALHDRFSISGLQQYIFVEIAGTRLNFIVKLTARVSTLLHERSEKVSTSLEDLMATKIVKDVFQISSTLRSLLLGMHFVNSVPRFLTPPQNVRKVQLRTLTNAGTQLLLGVITLN